MKVVAFCEIEEFPRRVLRKHWPDVPIYEDVQTLTADTLRRDGIAVDVIVGGWPCQDISSAGTRSGLDGARSGLWSEIARLAGELRPRFLILENSANLLGSPPSEPGRDFGRVLGDLATLGYNAEWHCLSAAAFDAPHIRDRLWITATLDDASRERCAPVRGPGDIPGKARGSDGQMRGRAVVASAPAANVAHVAHAGGERCGRTWTEPTHQDARSAGPTRPDMAHANSIAPLGSAIARQERHTWDAEPGVDRVGPRSPLAVDRVRALGNCNPPIIVETIARALKHATAESTR